MKKKRPDSGKRNKRITVSLDGTKVKGRNGRNDPSKWEGDEAFL